MGALPSALASEVETVPSWADDMDKDQAEHPENWPGLERPPVIPFGNLLAACRKHQMRARLYIFDGGETIEITQDSDGAQLLRVTAEHGDPYTAAEFTAKVLMERGLLSMFDFEG